MYGVFDLSRYGIFYSIYYFISTYLLCYNSNMIFYFCLSSIASKIRGKVTSIPFEQFHKHSAHIITAAVFGKDPDVHTEAVFPENNLVSLFKFYTCYDTNTTYISDLL